MRSRTPSTWSANWRTCAPRSSASKAAAASSKTRRASPASRSRSSRPPRSSAPPDSSAASPAATPAAAQATPATVPPPQPVNVNVEEVQLAAGGAGEAVVRLDIAEGFHVNANPASDKFYVATEVQAEPQEGITPGKPA